MQVERDGKANVAEASTNGNTNASGGTKRRRLAVAGDPRDSAAKASHPPPPKRFSPSGNRHLLPRSHDAENSAKVSGNASAVSSTQNDTGRATAEEVCSALLIGFCAKRRTVSVRFQHLRKQLIRLSDV